MDAGMTHNTLEEMTSLSLKIRLLWVHYQGSKRPYAFSSSSSSCIYSWLEHMYKVQYMQ